MNEVEVKSPIMTITRPSSNQSRNEVQVSDKIGIEAITSSQEIFKNQTRLITKRGMRRKLID